MRDKIPMQQLEQKVQGAYTRGEGCNCGILLYSLKLLHPVFMVLCMCKFPVYLRVHS